MIFKNKKIIHKYFIYSYISKTFYFKIYLDYFNIQKNAGVRIGLVVLRASLSGNVGFPCEK